MPTRIDSAESKSGASVHPKVSKFPDIGAPRTVPPSPGVALPRPTLGRTHGGRVIICGEDLDGSGGPGWLWDDFGMEAQELQRSYTVTRPCKFTCNLRRF